eukprot:1157708-Pelagomonas_calceolata.AAC.4
MLPDNRIPAPFAECLLAAAGRGGTQAPWACCLLQPQLSRHGCGRTPPAARSGRGPVWGRIGLVPGVTLAAVVD